MNENEQSTKAQDHGDKLTVNLALSIFLLLWVIMAILLEVYTSGWYLIVFGATISGGPALFIAGIIVSIIKKPKKSVIWILTLLFYLVSGALIIFYGISFA